MITNLNGKQSESRAYSIVNNAQERKKTDQEIDNVVFEGGRLLGKIDTVTGRVDLRVQSNNKRIQTLKQYKEEEEEEDIGEDDEEDD
jgi:hypothetical protein